MATNPFRPSFGASPPVLAGRTEELQVFTDALDAGPGAPGRAMLVTGPRGSGKTVMLNALEDAARERGWLVISQTARRGVADEIRDTQLPVLLSAVTANAVESHVTGANVNLAGGIGGGVTRTRTENYPVTPSLRSYLEKLTDTVPPEVGVVLPWTSCTVGHRRTWRGSPRRSSMRFVVMTVRTRTVCRSVLDAPPQTPWLVSLRFERI